MKSKIRKITVQGFDFNWSVTETDWNQVLLKIWVFDFKKCPWITIYQEFHNPWYLIGLYNQENKEKLNLNPVTPKTVAHIIFLALNQYGYPEQVKENHVKLENGLLIPTLRR